MQQKHLRRLAPARDPGAVGFEVIQHRGHEGDIGLADPPLQGLVAEPLGLAVDVGEHPVDVVDRHRGDGVAAPGQTRRDGVVLLRRLPGEEVGMAEPAQRAAPRFQDRPKRRRARIGIGEVRLDRVRMDVDVARRVVAEIDPRIQPGVQDPGQQGRRLRLADLAGVDEGGGVAVERLQHGEEVAGQGHGLDRIAERVRRRLIRQVVEGDGDGPGLGRDRPGHQDGAEAEDHASRDHGRPPVAGRS